MTKYFTELKKNIILQTEILNVQHTLDIALFFFIQAKLLYFIVNI